MKRRSKLLAFLMVLTLTGGVLAGCGTSGNQSEKDQSQTEQQNSGGSGKALNSAAEEGTSAPSETENSSTEEEKNNSHGQKSGAETAEKQSVTAGQKTVKKNDICRTTDLVNLRTAPSTEAGIIDRIPRNTRVHRYGVVNGFSEVSYQGKKGYVSNDYLKKEVSGSVNPSAEKTEKKTAGEQKHTARGLIVVIDPGHQAHANTSTEPEGPGSRTRKPKVSSGTAGTTTGVPEYKLTMQISEKLRTELRSRGYTVYFTRESDDVNISNAQRAEYATKKGADIYVRIHADGADSSSASGASVLYPPSDNPWVGSLSAKSKKLASDILTAYCRETGMHNRGLSPRNDMTGFNYATMPMALIELGFMTNPDDDRNMQKASFQTKMADGIANGIDAYFQ